MENKSLNFEIISDGKCKRIILIKPFDFGVGTEKTSEEIDKILYA